MLELVLAFADADNGGGGGAGAGHGDAVPGVFTSSVMFTIEDTNNNNKHELRDLSRCPNHAIHCLCSDWMLIDARLRSHVMHRRIKQKNIHYFVTTIWGNRLISRSLDSFPPKVLP